MDTRSLEVAAEFCDDILIANEVLGPGKAARVAALAKRIDITVVVDSQAALQDIAAAASDTTTTVTSACGRRRRRWRLLHSHGSLWVAHGNACYHA